jgi:hypothetical protein
MAGHLLYFMPRLPYSERLYLKIGTSKTTLKSLILSFKLGSMRLLFTYCATLIAISAFSQTDFYAVNASAANWNSSGTWSTDGVTPLTCAPCTAGVHYPGGGDNAYTNKKVVIVNGGFACKNLFLENDVVNGLSFFSSLSTLTINGSLASWDSDAPFYDEPIADIIENEGIINFTATNIDLVSPYVILQWDETVADFCSLRFTFGAGSGSLFETIRIGTFGASAKSLTVVSGTLMADPGAQIQGVSNATLTVSAGAFLETADAIMGTTSTTGFAAITVNGTLTTSSFVNATAFNMGSAGILYTSFTGSDQTEGWWYQTSRPTTGTLNATSTVSFNAAANQNVYARSYGNLTFEDSGTKTVAGSGTLNVTGNLNINSSAITFNSTAASAINIGGNVSNAGTWSPSDLITFNGTGAQSISGSAGITFSGGLTVNKASGTLTLARNITVASGVTITQGTFDLASYNLVLSSGNITNNGTLTPSSSLVTINGTTSIVGASTTSFYDLTINGTFTSPATLNIAGDLTNNNTFNSNSGTVIFNGTEDQTIVGAVNLNNVTINNSSSNGVGITGTANLSGVLTLTSGKFDADGPSNTGTFVVRSTAINSGGRIAAMTTPANFSGNVTVERFVDGPDDWRYLSMPITNGNVGMWQDDFSVTGNFSDATTPGQDPNVVSASAPSIYSFDGATQTYIAVGSGSTTAGTTLSNTTGYSAYVYETTDFTIDVTGTIGKGGINIATAANQYNLVPNPYPSAIDWDNVTSTGFSNNIYLTTSQGNFATYNKGTGIGVNHPDQSWTGQVAVAQSFWVQSTGATTLPLTETAKTSTYEFVREAQPRDYFKIKLNSFSQQTDEIAISFRDEATIGNDPDYDGLKRPTDGLVNLSSYISDPGVDYSINSVPRIQCTQSIKLKFNNVSSDAPVGEYVLTFSELDKLDLGYEITLKDNFSATQAIIHNGFSYTFQVTNDASSKGANRFEIILKSPDIDVTKDLSLMSTVECNNQMAKISFADTQPGVQYLFKLNDTSLHTPVAGNGSSLSAFIPKSLLSYGTNKLDLVASSVDGCNAHIFSDAVSVNLYELKEVSTVTNNTGCGEGSLTLTAQGAPIDGHYNWYESSTAIEPIPNAVGSSFTTPLLSETKIYYVTAVNPTGCESLVRAPVEARIVKLVAPDITVEGNTLSASKSLGLQWFKDGQPINGATSSTYTVTESGVYSVSYSASGCTTVSEGVKFSITGIDEGTSEDISVYPNPTPDFVHVKSRAIASAQIHVYDSQGRKISAQYETTGNDKVSVDLRRLSKGVYLIYIQNGNKVQQIKAIKK